MLKKLSKIEGSKELNKSSQKDIFGGWGPIEYIEYCGPSTNGYACLTGLPHCPTGHCANGVCSPDTN